MKNMRIVNLVQNIAALDKSLRREFVESLFNALNEKDRCELVQWVCHCAYPKTKWIKVERWMEGQFRRDINKVPTKVASICLNYFRINSKMIPFLVKKAQKIKHRVETRRRRHPEDFTDLNIEGQGEA